MHIDYPGIPDRPEPERRRPGTPPPVAAPFPAGGAPVPLPVVPDPLLERLLDERIVQLAGELDDVAADRAVGRLQLLAALDPRRGVTLHLGVRGGSAAAGLAVHDTLRSIGPAVATQAVGVVGPVGALLLAAGEPGHRRVLAHARIRLGQPAAGDPALPAEVGQWLRAQAAELLARHTGRTPAELAAELAADRWLTATDAVAFGLADEVLG